MTPTSATVEAARTVRELLTRYEITDQAQAKRLIRERFSQDDLDAFTAALAVLDGNGVLG